MSISDLLHYSIVMAQEKKENAKLLNKADDAYDDQDDTDAANNGFLQYLNITHIY